LRIFSSTLTSVIIAMTTICAPHSRGCTRREAGLLFQDLLREIRLETAAELCALADSEILVEGDGVDLLPSQRREQRRSLKR